jgi:hypothetical protein
MGMARDVETVTQTVRQVLERELAPAILTGLQVDFDLDQDGDPILLVQVEFQSDSGDLDASRVLGLPRHLREPLARLDEDAFPIFTFVKPGELEGEAA